MLIKRIISSIILLTILAVCLSIDWLCALMITGFIITGLYEFFTMLEKKRIGIYKYFGMCIGLIIPLSITFRFELTKNWELLFILLALLFLITMQFRRRDSSGVIVAISTTIFGIVYVSWLLSFLIKIRYMNAGTGLLLALIIITKLGDIGAYFVGSRFGKTPLMPRISPKKSVEGLIGGMIFSILGAFASQGLLNINYLHLITLGISLNILALLGDLSESLMKRDCQVKDAGKILPGMGGVLDFVDSFLFAAPAFYFYMSTILNG